MATIEVISHHVVYDNPIPHIRSRHGYFPGLVKLPSGDLLALFAMGEAMDAANLTTMVSRSRDQGKTWVLEGPLHQKEPAHRFDADNLKPAILKDGTIIATGYRFHRSDPDEPIVNPDTDGLRDGDNLVSFSRDEGHTWSSLRTIPRTHPELVETSGPSIELRNGTILVAGSLFPLWDGTHPSGHLGVLLRSRDKGETWDDETTFFRDPEGHFMPSEPRLCEMQDGRIVALLWTMDHIAGKNLPNHVTVSHDGGVTWSDMINTGIKAQASNLMHLGGDLLLTIHCHREGETGLFVRIVDFAGDRWRTVEESCIWNNTVSSKVGSYARMALSLKFGQASLLALDNSELLATHWAVGNGQGRILTHRLRVKGSSLSNRS